MKNIPSPESFISGLGNQGLNLEKHDQKHLFAKELETIKDDNSSRFQSDRDFEESNQSRKKIRSPQKTHNSADSDSKSSEEEKEMPIFFRKEGSKTKDEM